MVFWPPDLDPAVASFHVRNELETAIAPERIWPWLVRAERWPELYAGASHVRTPTPELALGTRFTWRTLGVSVTTVVEEFFPNERLAWRDSGVFGASAYHTWAFERRGAGAYLVTEETQRGFVPSLFRSQLKKTLIDRHQRWLEGLVRAATLGPPDEVLQRHNDWFATYPWQGT
jgi:hypothetical protein